MRDVTHCWDAFDSPCGPLLVVVNDGGAVVRIEFAHRRPPERLADALAGRGLEATRDRRRVAPVRAQIEAYLARERLRFDLALAPRGTPFQLDVWEALRRIPWGETVSYGELARRIGKPRAVRAVGRANGANPIPIVVPCHRVVGADGSLTGFGGGLEAKRLLLALESDARQLALV